MGKPQPPELKGWLEKRVTIALHGNKQLQGECAGSQQANLARFLDAATYFNLPQRISFALLRLSIRKPRLRQPNPPLLSPPGILRGFDHFMNLVVDGAIDMKEKVELGTVVLRGQAVLSIEALEKPEVIQERRH